MMELKLDTYTKVLDRDMVHGFDVAFVLAKLRQLSVDDDGFCLLTNKFLIKAGIVSSESAASRLIKKMVNLGLIIKKKERMGMSFVNKVKALFTVAKKKDDVTVKAVEPVVEVVENDETESPFDNLTRCPKKGLYVKNGEAILSNGLRHTLIGMWGRLNNAMKVKHLTEFDLDHMEYC